jgi:uncharacterized protein YkwD
MSLMARAGTTAPRTGGRSFLPRRITSLFLSLSMLLGAFGYLATPAATLAWDGNAFSSSSEAQLLSLTNQARAAAGLPALRVDSYLASVARWRSQDMIQNNYFSHAIPPSGYKVWDVFNSKGYCYQLAGENIAWNTYSDDVATAQVQSQFMNSAGHRAHILDARFDLVGIGAYKGPDGKKMWTVIFVDKCGSTTAPVVTSTPKPATTTPKTTKTTTTPAKPASTPTPTPTPVPQPTATPTATPTEEPEATPARVKTLAGAPNPTPDTTETQAAPAKEKGFFDMIGDAIGSVVSSVGSFIHGLISH